MSINPMPKTRRGRVLLASTVAGLTLVTATPVGAQELDPSPDPAPVDAPVICTYASLTYSLGAVVRFDTGFYYKCTKDGWVYQGLIPT